MGRKVAIRLSQVMITKNEEKNIERALSWGKDIVYEQIVVDTGSTDRTVELAKKMGATVLHFDWINDFAAAKNFALKHASGDWIAFLDADEYFEVSEAKRIMKEIKNAEKLNCNCMIQYILNLRSDNTIQDEIQQTRIIKNRCGMHYVGAIHEHLACKSGLKGYYPKERLAIFHTGYISEALQEKIDSKRNLTIIQNILENDGDDPDMYGYLGDEYMIRGKSKEAIEAYTKSIELYGEKLPDGDRPIWSLGKLICLLVDDEQLEKAKEYYEIAVKRYPSDVDFDFYIGKEYFRLCEFETSIPYFERIIHVLNEDISGSGRDSTTHLELVYEMLSFAYLKANRLKDAVRISSVLLHANNTKDNVLATFLMAFSLLDGDREANAQVAFQGMAKFYDLSRVEDCITICKAAMTAEYKEFIGILDRELPPEMMQKMAEALRSQAGE